MNRRFGAATGGAIVAALAAELVLAPTATMAATAKVASTGTEVSALSTSAYGPVLVWTGKAAANASDTDAPLYEFSGDANGKFGCTTRVARGDDVYGAGPATFSCTGPESDILEGDAGTDDWPALTTTGALVAGPGVDQNLLGTVQRPHIGDQVTYGGHPLYLFDPPSNPFQPQGEGYLESVAPMFPWHGIWYLVSAKDGLPVPGPISVGTAVLPDKKVAVAYMELPSPGPFPVAVYSYSLDRPGISACTGACAVTWPPLITTGQPKASSTCKPCVAAKDLGTIRRPDGTEQVTYKGKPLYLYSGQQWVFSNPAQSNTSYGGPSYTHSIANGNGLHGPNGGTFSVVYLDQ